MPSCTIGTVNTGAGQEELSNLNLRQQAQQCIVSETLLANEGRGIGFGTGVVVDTAEPDVLDPFYRRSRSRSMLATSHFTFPLAIRTVVGPGVIYVGVTALQLAVAQHEDSTNFNTHSIEGNRGQRIESVFDHDWVRARVTDNDSMLGHFA